jgi:hypothetical protein
MGRTKEELDNRQGKGKSAQDYVDRTDLLHKNHIPPASVWLIIHNVLKTLEKVALFLVTV